MKMVFRIGILLASATVLAFAAITFWGCSDDDETLTNGGKADTDPPEVVSVTAKQVRSIDVVFSEAVDQAAAQDEYNYFFVRDQSTDTLWTTSAALQSDGKIVGIATDGDMQNATYHYHVSGIKDLNGNTMTTTATGTFAGNTDADNTPPEIIHNSPASGQTGVDVTASIVVQFSEPMQTSTVKTAFSLRNGIVISTEMYAEAGNTYRFVPVLPLARNTEYTVSISGTAMDLAGNPLQGNPTWTFRTTAEADNTPPHLIASTPTNNATNVDRAIDIVFYFSEPVDPNSLDNILMTPDPGNGAVTFSNGGADVTFNPNQDLAVNTQYNITIPAGSVRDLAGNSIATTVEILFTTGLTFETGRISGRLSGDSYSLDATSPGGALVIASTEIVFDSEGPPPIFGIATASGNGSYNIQHLPDDTYYLAAILDSNDDGDIDPEYGDAVGLYGVNIRRFDITPDTVVVSGGRQVSGVDFTLFDFAVVSGTVGYVGTNHQGELGSSYYYVGMFDASSFDPVFDPIPEPDYGTLGNFLTENPNYLFGGLEGYLGDGTYYVGAFLDLDGDGSYDEGVEPAGFYEVGGQPGIVTVDRGRDVFEIDINMDDPDGGGAGATVVWGGTPAGGERTDKHRRLLQVLKQALAQVKRTGR